MQTQKAIYNLLDILKITPVSYCKKDLFDFRNGARK